MYSRPREDFGISLPGDYCGTAFKEDDAGSSGGICDRGRDESETCEMRERQDCAEGRRAPGISSFLSELPLFRGLGGLGLSVPAFGTEDILIIATAAFLFFSKSGDKECAIMILLLIFIAN